MSRRHDNALLAIIRSIPTAASKTFLSSVTSPDGSVVNAPYVVVHPADGTDNTDRLAGPATTQHPRWTIHSVGTTTDQAKWVAEQIKAKIIVAGIGITPTIEGESAGAFWYSSPLPVQTDDDFTPPLHYHVAECGFSSDPA
jgi:hypothetical protein